MRQQVEELNEAANRKRLKLLGPEECLTQVDVLDDLQGDQLRDMHSGTPGRWLGELPPVLAEQRRVLV